MSNHRKTRPTKKGTSIQFFEPDYETDFRLVRGLNVAHSFPSHVHRSYTLGVVLSGERVICSGGKDQSITAPDGFIINPYQPHSCPQQESHGHDYLAISISQAVMAGVFKQITGQAGLPYFPDVKISRNDAAGLVPLIDDFDIPEGNPDFSALSIFLETLIRNYACKEPIDRSILNFPTFVDQISSYMEENTGRHIELKHLSQLVHVSPYHLNRIFREKTGLPPKAYLLQLRIKKSIRLLQKNRSISDAAYDLGFSDQSHFSRFFKLNVGISPGRFLDTNDSEKVNCDQ